MLFNTLANLRVLIGIDPPRAQAMLDRLIAFLRATLNASRSAHAPAGHRVRAHRRLPGADGRAHGRPAADAAVDLPDDLRDVGRCRRCCCSRWWRTASSTAWSRKVAGGRIEVSARRDGEHAGAERARQRRRPRRRRRAGRHALRPAAGARAAAPRCTAAAPAWTLQDAAGGGTLARIRLPLDRDEPPADRADRRRRAAARRRRCVPSWPAVARAAGGGHGRRRPAGGRAGAGAAARRCVSWTSACRA